MDEDLLGWPHVCLLDERLPRSERDQRYRCRLLHAQARGLECEIFLLDRDPFRERPDAKVDRTGVDLVARLEALNRGTDADDHAGKVVSQDEREAVGQQPLELAGGELGVERVDACGANLDEHVARLDRRLGHVGRSHRPSAVLLDDVRLHRIRASAGPWPDVVPEAESSSLSLRICLSTTAAGMNRRAAEMRRACEPAG